MNPLIKTIAGLGTGWVVSRSLAAVSRLQAFTTFRACHNANQALGAADLGCRKITSFRAARPCSASEVASDQIRPEQKSP